MQEYFTKTVQKVLTSIGCTMEIPITILDHETLKGKDRQALGLCWKDEVNNTYNITIDEFFVKECYLYFELNSIVGMTWELGSGDTLEKVICHELAHVGHWRHGKKHTELTNKLLSKVGQPEKYYQYLHKKFRMVTA